MHRNFKWQTPVDFSKYPFRISYQDRIMALGSCFVAYMGEHLSKLKYQIELNPFGIQYHPQAICHGIDRLIQGENIEAEELVSHQGLWHSWMHHGSFSSPDRAACLQGIRERFEQARQHLMQTDYLLITLGTSWVYRLEATGEQVNNCHKFPASLFKREALPLESIVSELGKTIQALRSIRPNLQVLATVSPVRHLKDGAIENQRSKARLLLALAELESMGKLHYFPAYELMMDELRDYRFYAEDLTHPAPLAQDYIWQCFDEQCLSEPEAAWRRRVGKLQSGLAHRPLHPARGVHRKFLEGLLRQLEALRAELPGELDWRAERAKIENQLQAID